MTYRSLKIRPELSKERGPLAHSPDHLLLLDVLGGLVVLAAGEDVQQVVHNEGGVLAVPAEVLDALRIGHAHVVPVRAVHQLRLLQEHIHSLTIWLTQWYRAEIN